VIAKQKLLIGVVAALAALAAYWFLLLAPKREEAAALATKVEAAQAAVAQAEATLGSYREAQAAYKGLSATVARLGKAVPAGDDVRSLVVQLESAAAGSEVDFASIQTGAASAPDPATASAATDVAAPPGASAGFSAMSFNLEFKGSYLRLSELFSRLERFVRVRNERIDVTGRLLRVEGLTMTPESGDYRRLGAKVTVSTYLVPATAGLAATPAAPATGTTPPSDGGTTPPVTTATSTGTLR
jgi:hypothetical protein